MPSESRSSNNDTGCETCTKKDTEGFTFLKYYDYYYIFSGIICVFVGANWKRILLAYVVSALYLGWIYGVDYNYQPLAEKDLGFNVLYSVHLKPFISNIWYSASGNDTTQATQVYPPAFSVLDCVNMTLFGYLTYLFNGWFGSYFSMALLVTLDIPFPCFLLFDIIASGRKYNFQGFFPTISYYVIITILVFGVLKAFLTILQPKLIYCPGCRHRRILGFFSFFLEGFDIYIMNSLIQETLNFSRRVEEDDTNSRSSSNSTRETQKTKSKERNNSGYSFKFTSPERFDLSGISTNKPKNNTSPSITELTDNDFDDLPPLIDVPPTTHDQSTIQNDKMFETLMRKSSGMKRKNR